jgi:general secretion pathway protein C
MMKRVFTLSNILLITAAIFLGVKAFYKVTTPQFEQGSLAQPASKPVQSPQLKKNQPLARYNPIIGRNLFKTKIESQIAPKPVEKPVLEELPPTKLQLKLWGTVTGDPSKAYAVVEETKNRKQNLYRVGDAIQNAIVKMILREKIVLTVGGKDEFLEMEDKKTGKRTLASPRTPFSAPRRIAARPQNIKLKRKQIEDAMKDINSLMSQAKIQPHLENGSPDGLILTGIKPRSIFRRLGLRNGDIITGVDGEQIQTVDSAMRFYENLRTSTNTSIQIKRRGREKTINYNID